jgi:hypothetical protein
MRAIVKKAVISQRPSRGTSRTRHRKSTLVPGECARRLSAAAFGQAALASAKSDEKPVLTCELWVQ